MKCFVLGLFLSACLAVGMAEVGVKCTDQSQCGADECCQIINIVIATRKRWLDNVMPRPNTSGVCQKFKQTGDTCQTFEVMNGYCGCADGLVCKSVHVTTTPLPRLSPRRPAPGYHSYCFVAPGPV